MIPCEECICIPICKGRDFRELTDCCSLMSSYLHEYELKVKENEKLVIDIPQLGHIFHLAKFPGGAWSWGVDRESQFYMTRMVDDEHTM